VNVIDNILNSKAHFVDYNKIIINKYTALNSSEELAIIINSLHSLKVLQKTISFIKFSLEKANIKASITVVQNSEMPTHRDFCIKNNLNYVFIPYNKKQFSKGNDAFCYNIGVLANLQSNCFIVQRSDVLIPHDFFANYKINGQNFFSNCSLNTIYQVDKQGVEFLLNKQGLYNLYQLQDVINIFCDCGTSVSFTKKAFFAVGGFDVELGIKDESVIFNLFKNKIDFLKLINYQKNYGLNIFRLAPQKETQYTIDQEIMFQFKNLTSLQKKQYIVNRQQFMVNIVEKLKNNNKIGR